MNLFQSIWTPVFRKILFYLAAVLGLAAVGYGSQSQATALAQIVPMQALAVSHSSTEFAATGSTQIAATASESVTSTAPPATTSSSQKEQAKVDINTATEEDLRRLPGVGHKRAIAILELRKRKGGSFRRVEDLLQVKGIGIRMLNRLRPLIVVGSFQTQTHGM